jgi:hypothetical protein
MKNTDPTQNCTDALILLVNNDEWLHQSWRKTLRAGNMVHVKDALEEAGFTYTPFQWQALEFEFEDELQAEEDAQEANEFFVELSTSNN